MEEEKYKKFVDEFSNTLYAMTNGRCFSEVICLCIGTDRATGDSFGPLVGYKLECLYKGNECISIIGNLNETVNSSNINEIMRQIENTYENPFIIAIDSAISNYRNPGDIIVSSESVSLAAGLSRRIECIGDMSIKGVVARKSNNPRCNLNLIQNARLNLVMNMADIVANGIYNVIEIS